MIAIIMNYQDASSHGTPLYFFPSCFASTPPSGSNGAKEKENSMPRSALMFTVFLLAVSFALQAEARPKNRYDETTKTCRILESGPLEWDSRPWGEGGKVFREACKVCHSRGNDQGAPFLWVESKTPAAWNRVFAQRYPKCAQNGSWDKITLDQQLKLNDYLYRFGLNSEDINDSC